MESVNMIRQAEAKNRKKILTKLFNEHYIDANNNAKVKSMLHFHYGDWNSVKSIAVKKQSNMNVTTRFVSSKLLMYAKVSIANFIYDVVDVFCFPNRDVSKMYSPNKILKCFLYLLHTDTGNCSLQFLFVCSKSCCINKGRS